MVIGIINFILLLFACHIITSRSAIFSLPSLPTYTAPLLFWLKLLAATAVWFIYSYHYTDRSAADIFTYFDDAAQLYKASQNELTIRFQLLSGIYEEGSIPRNIIQHTMHWDKQETLLINDNRVMIRLHLFLYHFSHGFYGFHLLFFCFASLLGTIWLLRLFFSFGLSSPLVLLTVLFPSFLFWTSAPLKESWLVFSLGLFLFYGYKSCKVAAAQNILLCSIGLALLLSLKVYILFSMLPALLFIAFSRNNYLSIFFHLAWPLLLLLIIGFSSPSFVKLLQQQQTSFSAISSNAGSLLEPISYHDFGSLLLALPRALFTTFIQPAFFFESGILSILSSLEHISMLAFTLFILMNFKKPKPAELRFSLFCLSFCAIAAAIIALTTPVMGAILRYKAPLIPFYIAGLLTFVSPDRLSSYLKKLTP
jgi:hypothetical protein